MKKEDYIKKIETELNHEIEDLDGKCESRIVALSTILANLSVIRVMNNTSDIVTQTMNNIGNMHISDSQIKEMEKIFDKHKFMG